MAPYIGSHIPDVGGFTASAAIDKYRAVSIDSGTTVHEATAGSGSHGQRTKGIASESDDSGDADGLVASGVYPAIVNGASVAIADTDPMKTTTGGIFIKADTTADLADYEACEAATTDGVVILLRRIKHTVIA